MTAACNDEPPPMRAADPITIERDIPFERLLGDAKGWAPAPSTRVHPDLDAATAIVLNEMPDTIRADEGFEGLQEALRSLATVLLPAMARARAWLLDETDRHTRGFHMRQGTWWPHQLSEGVVERLEPFWPMLAPVLVDDGAAAARDERLCEVAHQAATRSAEYEAAELVWRADEGNQFASFLVHSSHVHGRADVDTLEAARAAAVTSARERATAYEAADAATASDIVAKDGMVDWSKTDQSMLLRHVEMDSSYQELSDPRPRKGPRASLRRINSSEPTGANRHAYKATSISGSGGAIGGATASAVASAIVVHEDVGVDGSALEGFPGLTGSLAEAPNEAVEAPAGGGDPAPTKKKKKKKAVKRLSSFEIPLWAQARLEGGASELA